MVTKRIARRSRAHVRDKLKEEGRGELLFDVTCLPCRLGFVLKHLDCVSITTYTTANMYTSPIQNSYTVRDIYPGSKVSKVPYP